MVVKALCFSLESVSTLRIDVYITIYLLSIEIERGESRRVTHSFSVY